MVVMQPISSLNKQVVPFISIKGTDEHVHHLRWSVIEMN